MSPAATRTTFRRLGAGVAVATLAALGVVATPMSASAATFTVTTLADSGAGSLRDAITTANATAGPDIISFDPSIPANSVIPVASQIVITGELTIDGAGVTGLTVAPAASGFVMLEVEPSAAGLSYEFSNFTIDGTAVGAGFTGFGINISGGTPALDVTLDGMTLRNLTGPEGPGLRVFALSAGGGVLITDSTFENNTSTASTGGAVYLRGISGSISIDNSTFDGNESSQDGGAIYVEGTGGGTPSLDLDTVSFTNNSANGGGGGAVGSDFISNVSIVDSEFNDNTSSTTGGALDFALQDSSASTVIFDSSFDSNSSAGTGGAINFSALNGGSFISFQSSFTANTSGGNGGAVALPDLGASIVQLISSTFADNLATNAAGTSGGGVSVGTISNNGGVFVFGSTFNHNLVSNINGGGGTSFSVGTIFDGGAVLILASTFFEANPFSLDAILLDGPESGGEVQFVSSTLVANGGIRSENNAGSVIVSNSIVDGDVLNTGADAFTTAGDPFTVEYSILSDAFSAATMINGGGNLFSTDPQLGALANNGGPTLTMLPATGSPAINAGDPAYSVGLPQDQRGEERIALGRVDIGAVELQTLALAATGLEISPLAPVGGAALLLLGAAAVLFARRRRAA
jgi:predicted outer membrane repeat protein